MTQIWNPGGAFGYTDVGDLNWSQQIPMKAGADIAAGNVVALQTDFTVIKAATDVTAHLVVGQAVAAISSGKVGLIRVHGATDDLVAEGTIGAAAILKRSATTTGAVAATATPAAGEVFAISVAASASGVVKAWICKAAVTS